MKPVKGDMLLVEWVDQSYYHGPVDAVSPAMQKAYGFTLGYFLEQGEGWLCMAMERFETDGTFYRHIVTFPLWAVKKIKKLKVVK